MMNSQSQVLNASLTRCYLMCLARRFPRGRTTQAASCCRDSAAENQVFAWRLENITFKAFQTSQCDTKQPYPLLTCCNVCKVIHDLHFANVVNITNPALIQYRQQIQLELRQVSFSHTLPPLDSINVYCWSPRWTRALLSVYSAWPRGQLQKNPGGFKRLPCHRDHGKTRDLERCHRNCPSLPTHCPVTCRGNCDFDKGCFCKHVCHEVCLDSWANPNLQSIAFSGSTWADCTCTCVSTWLVWRKQLCMSAP